MPADGDGRAAIGPRGRLYPEDNGLDLSINNCEFLIHWAADDQLLEDLFHGVISSRNRIGEYHIVFTHRQIRDFHGKDIHVIDIALISAVFTLIQSSVRVSPINVPKKEHIVGVELLVRGLKDQFGAGLPTVGIHLQAFGEQILY